MRRRHEGQVFQAVGRFAAVEQIGAVGEGKGVLEVQPGDGVDIEVEFTAVDPGLALDVGELAVLSGGVWCSVGVDALGVAVGVEDLFLEDIVLEVIVEKAGAC